MSDSSMIARLLLACLLLTPSAVGAQSAPGADEKAWLATCSQDGRLVYRESMTEMDAATRQPGIVQRYPGATCVFIAKRGTEAAMAQDAMGVVDLAPGTPIDDSSLDAALRAIMGENVQEMPVPVQASLPSAPTPVLPLVEEPDFATPPQYAPQPGWMRLSTYRTASISDALQDWNRLLLAYPRAGRYLPAARVTDDGYVMLSAGPVPAHEVEDFCIAAQSMDMDCDPREAARPSRGYDYLSFLFPEVFGSGDAFCTPAGVNIGHEPPPNRDPGRSCWRNVAFMPTEFPMPVAAEGERAIDSPPLPRRRPDFSAARVASEAPAP